MLFLYGYEANTFDKLTAESFVIAREIYPGKIAYGLFILLFSIVTLWYSGKMKKTYNKSKIVTILHSIHIFLLIGIVIFLIMSISLGRIRIL